MNDSLKLEATGDDKDRLIELLNLCSCQSATGLVKAGNMLKIVHDYDAQSPEPRLSFKPALLADAIMDWIERTRGHMVANFPKEPDIDGHCKRGWRLVSGGWHDPIEIHPHWMIYHK